MAKPAPKEPAPAVVMPPVGSIIAWHPELFKQSDNDPIPTLPPEWVICDGQLIDDPESLLNGKTTPLRYASSETSAGCCGVLLRRHAVVV